METVYHPSNSRLADLLASPVILTRFLKGAIAGPDGRSYFETPTADSPLRELWEGGDVIVQLTTSDGQRWEARPGDSLPRPQDWVAIK
ncbi:MAG: hypothetical protein ABI222_17360 [Opitutaceae bacterium]